MAYQIIFVESLHDDNDASGRFIIETTDQRMVIPVIYSLALCVRIGFLGLERVVDDNEIPASTRQKPAYRRGQPAAIHRCLEIVYRLAGRSQASRAEGVPVELRHH